MNPLHVPVKGGQPEVACIVVSAGKKGMFFSISHLAPDQVVHCSTITRKSSEAWRETRGDVWFMQSPQTFAEKKPMGRKKPVLYER